MEHRLKYRPEIDGLRAIAVGAVLLYHAKLGVPHGYVGVDMFFVISGYLITSLILKDYSSPEGFSIVQFWERRVRRIFPALLVVIAATLVAGWFLLLPSHFEKLGASVQAQAAFAGNIYFWATSGYFSNDAATIPLLHTWSLGVEEQYYLLFPLLFLLPVVWTHGRLRCWLGVLFVGSLALSIYQVNKSPDAAYYLLPSRAWELMAGALLAVLPVRPQTPRWVLTGVSWGGLGAVLAAMFFYQKGTPFPGWAALPPVLGTAAMIWSMGQNEAPSLLRRLLSWRPVVFIGLISYSLYLWHWPLLVYGAYWPERHILWWPWRLGLLALSFVLAVLCWRYVETPFRRRVWCADRRRLFLFGAALPVVCVVAGGAVVKKHGFPGRYAEEIVSIDRGSKKERTLAAKFPMIKTTDLKDAREGRFYVAGPERKAPEVLLWGDSQAMALAPAFQELAEETNVKTVVAWYGATAPLIGHQSEHAESLTDDSPEWSQAIVDYAKENRISRVVLAASWGLYADLGRKGEVRDPDLFDDVAQKLAATVRELRQAGAEVWIFKRVPMQTTDYRIGMARARLEGRPQTISTPRADYASYTGSEEKLFGPAVTAGASVIDVTNYFFVNGDRSLLEDQGYILYADGGHLSAWGALRLKPLFQKMFADQEGSAGALDSGASVLPAGYVDEASAEQPRPE